jgi:hypothetical protein
MTLEQELLQLSARWRANRAGNDREERGRKPLGNGEPHFALLRGDAGKEAEECQNKNAGHLLVTGREEILQRIKFELPEQSD